MKRSLLTITINLSWLLSIHAIPSQQVTWQTTDVPQVAQGYQYKLYITEESGKKSVVPLVNTLCGGTGIYECSTALPVAGNVAIISNNSSVLTATNANGLESEPSPAFIGNQGCILRDNLYKIGQEAQIQTNKNNMNGVLNEFKAAKFKYIRTEQKSNNQFIVFEQCAGFIQP